LRKQGSGYYQCYCTQHSKASDASNKNNLCADFQRDKYTAKVLNIFVAASVAIINIVIRTINMKLVDFIGYDTDSKRVSLVMISVFIAQMVNTGIVTLLTNANLQYSIAAFLPIRSQYPDMDRDWYMNIGVQMQKTMLIMAFMPYIEICISHTIKFITRGLDRGFCKGKGTTKKTTQFQYVTLYSGPIYMMHFKYSSVLTQVFMSFTYGLFLPALFPIAMIGIANLYICEKYQIYYWYRKPPMFDDKLNKQAIGILLMAPIFMFLMSFWAFGNQQMFFGKASIIEHNNVIPDPEHPLFMKGFNQTTMCLLIFVFLLTTRFVLILIDFIKRKLSGGDDDEEDILDVDVEENIDIFWKSLEGTDQKNMYADEVYKRNKFGVKGLSNNALEILRTTDRRNRPKAAEGDKKKIPKYIHGDSTYDMLTNIEYQ